MTKLAITVHLDLSVMTSADLNDLRHSVNEEIERRLVGGLTHEERAMSPIDAIRAIRQRLRVSLKDAKDFYDARRAIPPEAPRAGTTNQGDH